MTTPPDAFAQFGQTLAFAERQTTPETWYALQLIATRGPGLDRNALSRDLEGSPNLDADSTRELLARLETEGLIHGDAQLDLTTEGEALHRSLRESIAGPRNQLLSHFDVEDIETTVRTLQAITERAEKELTVAG